MESFAKRLKQLREQAGFTQEQLAERVGVTRQAISRWEQGITQPDMEMLVTLSDTLQVNAEALAFGKSSKAYVLFQKRHLVATVAAFGFGVITLLLMVFLDPYLKVLVNRYDFDSFLYFWAFRLLLPPAGCFALGFGSVAFIALFYNTCLNRPWRIALLCLGLTAIVPSLLVLLDDALNMIIDGYSARITWTLYIGTIRVPAVQTLLYRLLPIVAGVFCFLGTNKK